MALDKNMTRLSVDSLRKELGIAHQSIRALERALAEREQEDGQRRTTLRTIVQSETFLAQSAEIAHLGYAIWDEILDRDVTVSEEFARIHGLTRDEYLETISSMEKYLEFVVQNDREKYLDYENQFAADDSGKGAGVEYRIMRPDGEIRHLYQRSQYVPAPSGRPSHQSIVVIQDITEQKQVELRLKKSKEALEESEAWLTQSVAMANLGHAIWDYGSENYIDVSEEWASIFGYSKEEFLAKFTDVEKDNSLIHPDDLDRYVVHYEDEDPDDLAPDIEYRIVTRTNEIRHLLQSNKYVFNEPGEHAKSLVTILDITDRIERENELNEARNAAEQASVAKSSFLANMSHEMRTPLNAIINLNALLLDSALDPQQHELASSAYQESKALSVLIRDILDFSKIEAGSLESKECAFGLHGLFDELETVFRAQADNSGLDFSMAIATHVPNWVKGDEPKLRQVLVNLIGNGLKFTKSGGVTVNVQAAGDQSFLFRVNDTGIGISADSIEHVFTEFYQQDASFSRKFGGVGLGLAISRSLVQAMGGEISCKQLPKGGSSFWFTIPLEETTPPEKTMLPHVIREPISAKVLVVDDSHGGQLVAGAILRKAGCNVQAASNGAEAVRALSNQHFDIVLMDLSMPVMDGMEATRKIRALGGEASRTPIVAMTANAFPEDRDRCLQAGMNDFISKPISSGDLLDVVAHWAELAHGDLSGVSESASDDVEKQKSIVADSGPACNEKPVGQLMDIGVLESMEQELSREVVNSIVGVYIHETGEHISALCKAGETANVPTMMAEAHAIKSSACTFGAFQLAEAAKAVEILARQDNQAAAIAAIAAVEELVEKTMQHCSSKYPALPND